MKINIKPNQKFAAKAGIADFIQPSLGPLQPNLDDFMNGIPLQGIYKLCNRDKNVIFRKVR